jgi:hypothetical protein
VRRNIFHGGQQLGYFTSKAEALEAIAKFEAANAANAEASK